MQTEMLLGGLFLLFVVQVIGTHLQVKEYRRAVKELHRLGNVGIGSRRRRLGPSNIVIIACDSIYTQSMRRCRIRGARITKGILRRSMR